MILITSSKNVTFPSCLENKTVLKYWFLRGDVNNAYYFSFKVSCRFWLAPLPWLILHNKPALTNNRRYEQYTIDSMVNLIGNEVDRCYIGPEKGCLGLLPWCEELCRSRRLLSTSICIIFHILLSVIPKTWEIKCQFQFPSFLKRLYFQTFFANPFQNKVKKNMVKSARDPCVLHSNLRHYCVYTGQPVSRWAVGIDFNFELRGK